MSYRGDRGSQSGLRELNGSGCIRKSVRVLLCIYFSCYQSRRVVESSVQDKSSESQ